MKEKILLAMSGGVDSSMCVHYLKEEGYDVYGYTFLSGDDNHKKESIKHDAQVVADFFNIKLIVKDLTDDFRKITIADFLSEYQLGRTPNPCVICNRTIKFPSLIKTADELGIDKVATGHYVQRGIMDGEVSLLKGVDSKKDQSYVLYGLSKEILSRCYFPLGDISKGDIRKLAQKIDLPVATKKDSQEICFISDDDYRRYIRENAAYKIKRGSVISSSGEVLGDHDGIPFYTIGQRKGLGLALGRPAYIYKLDSQNNTIYVGDEELLYSKELSASQVNILKDDLVGKEFECLIKIRYKSPFVEGRVVPVSDDKVLVKFNESQRSVTGGQSVVFYEGDRVLGGGVID